MRGEREHRAHHGAGRPAAGRSGPANRPPAASDRCAAAPAASVPGHDHGVAPARCRDRDLRLPVFPAHRVAPARRPGQHLAAAPARGCADALADQPGQRDQGGRLGLGGHRGGAVGGRADDDLPALAAPAGLRGQPVLPGDSRAVDLLRPVPAASLRRVHHRQLGRVLGAVSAGRRAHDLPHGRGVLPGGARPPARLRQGRRGRGAHRLLPGPAVPGRRSPGRRAPGRRARGRGTGHGVPLLHPERGVPRRVPPGPDRPCRCRAAGAARRSGWPPAISSG